VATIYPFQFVVPEGFSLEFIIRKFKFGSAVKDYLQNILLFIPFGISLAAIYERKQRSTLVILIICLISAVVSTAVEVTQFCLPVRISNLTDIIYNSLGGTLGGVFYCCRSNINKFALGIVKAEPEQLSLKSLIIAIAGYCSLVILSVGVLLINVNLSNWDEDFYLAIGNEVTGDRPWNGYIYNLYISDRSLETSQIKQAFEQTDSVFPDSSLVTALNFSQVKNYYPDLSQQIPNLLWQSSSFLRSDRGSKSSGILLNSEQWLKTAEPARYLTKRLKNTGEFSLFITISTNEFNQTGPARIISLSKGVYNHNLIIGQEKTDLSFRLRTPITGSSATQPEFIIPKVFNSNTVHQVIITFADNRLNFYLDKSDRVYSFEFTPSICFVAYFPWQKQNWIINLSDFNINKYQRYFYRIVIVPLAILIFALVYYLAVKQSAAKSSDS
jgi:glycopeptide antibiotics resistance protein